MHKIKHKKTVAVIVIAALAVSGTIGAYFLTREKDSETKIASNQRIAYAYITSLQGNEVTYMEVEESVVTAALESSSDSSTKSDKTADTSSDSTDSQKNSGTTSTGDTSGSDSSSGDAQSGGAPSGDFPSDMGTSPSGDMPSDMGTPPSGDMLSDMGTPPSGDMPDGAVTGDASEDGTSVENTAGQDAEGTETAESGSSTGTSQGNRGGKMNMMESSTIVTSMIPVGTTVHTASDTVTTFSRLTSGDLLKLLLETDADGNEVIIEIWMLQ